MSLSKRDDACLHRSKLCTEIPIVLARITPAEHGNHIRTEWMDGADAKYDAFANVTLGQIVKRIRVVYAQLSQMRMYPPSVDLATKKQYYGEKFRSLAVMSVPIGRLAPTEDGQKSTPVVYVFLDSKGSPKYVMSNGQIVKPSEIMYYTKTISQDWKEEIAFRQEIAELLVVAHMLPEQPASFAEINMAMEDLRHVPLLAIEVGKLGLLDGITMAQVEATTTSRRSRWQPIENKLQEFLSELGDDERAFIALLVRAAAILHQVFALENSLQSRVDKSTHLDRVLWLVIREVVMLTGTSPTFRLDKDETDWSMWLWGLDTLEPREDGDLFFQHTYIFDIEDLPRIMDIAPIAANRPLERAIPSKHVLASGYLTCGYAPDNDYAGVYRSMIPTHTLNYSDAMKEMFGDEESLPAVPTQPYYPQPPPAKALDTGPWPMLTAIYEKEVALFTDGRPAGSTWIIIQYLKELYKALKVYDWKRFETLRAMRKGWEQRGWLEVNSRTTGYNTKDIDQRNSDYRRGLGQPANAPNEYRKQQSERARKERDRVLLWSAIGQRSQKGM